MCFIFNVKVNLIARLIIAAVLTSFGSSTVMAGEISVYKDEDGVINLTDRPAPSGARVQHVIRYKKKSTSDLDQEKAADDQKRQAAELQKDVEQNQALQNAAVKAREEAEKENALAREKIEAAEKYLERYRQKKRRLRRRHRHEAQRIAREAQEAQARANAAIERADMAEEAARKGVAAPSGKTK